MDLSDSCWPQGIADSEQAKFQCNLVMDGRAARADPDGSGKFEPCDSPKPYVNLEDGMYTFSVRAVDEAGNIGRTVSAEFKVDQTPPVIFSILTQSGGAELPSFNASSSATMVATSQPVVTMRFKISDGAGVGASKYGHGSLLAALQRRGNAIELCFLLVL